MTWLVHTWHDSFNLCHVRKRVEGTCCVFCMYKMCINKSCHTYERIMWCIHMYVYVLYIYSRVFVHLYTYTCLHEYVYKHTNICTCIHKYTFMYMCGIYIHVHLYTHSCLHINIHKCKYMYTQIWKCIHVYISNVHQRVMSHVWMSHVTCMDESCHIYAWVMSHI